MHLGTSHEKAVIFGFFNGGLGHWRVKAGPARPGIKLCLRVKQRRTATNTMVNTGIMLVIEGARKCRFGAMFAGHAKLLPSVRICCHSSSDLMIFSIYHGFGLSIKLLFIRQNIKIFSVADIWNICQNDYAICSATGPPHPAVSGITRASQHWPCFNRMPTIHHINALKV